MSALNVEKLAAEAASVFGSAEGSRAYFAPGRVNLIGEHIDYCGGRVLPCALDMGTCLFVRERGDRQLNFYSLNLPEAGVIHTSIDEDRPEQHFGWADYPRGVIFTLKKQGFAPRCGLDLFYYGDIPAGAGLSSSASIEVVTAYALRDLWGFSFDDRQLALAAQTSEHIFNNTNCGIMDQFVVAFGRKEQAVYLDTASLEYEYVPLELGDAVLVITDSKVKHELAGSAYNDRRAQCESALKDLKECLPRDLEVEQLCGLTPEVFDHYKAHITDPVCRRRAEHVVYENERVKEAVEALGKGDKKRFGVLMNMSHSSLKDLFEVTVPETDLLCALAQEMEGVYGSRMTGGGFGGSTVTLVEKDAVPGLIDHIHEEYLRRTGLEAACYIASAGAGPRRIDNV